MNTFKLKMKRQQKRHDKQQWTKEMQKELSEEIKTIRESRSCGTAKCQAIEDAFATAVSKGYPHLPKTKERLLRAAQLRAERNEF